MTLELHATPEEVMRAVAALQGFGREQGLTEREIFGLSLALEESGSNIVNHGLQRDPQKTFQVSIEQAGSVVRLTLRDPGPEFDPTRTIPGAPADEDQVGGWGLELVRHYIDEIHYAREGEENVLRLTKRLAGAPRQN